MRSRRRVRRDSTLSIDGIDYELSLGFLAGTVVSVARSFSDRSAPPCVEHAGKSYALHRVDPIKNAHRKRPERDEQNATAPRPTGFNPARALLDKASGRPSTTQEDEAF